MATTIIFEVSSCSVSFTFSSTGTPKSACPKVAAKKGEDKEPTNVEGYTDVGNSGHCKGIRGKWI